MSKSVQRIKESTLSTNLNDSAHNLVRELAMACRKMSIYGAGHPQSARAVEKPFFVFGEIFAFKSVVNFNVSRGQLHIMNILLKESVFTQQVTQFLQAFDITGIVFDRTISVQQLTTFLTNLVSRDSMSEFSTALRESSESSGDEPLQVNSELAHSLFEDRKTYRGDVSGDYSVRRLALDQLEGDLSHLAKIQRASRRTLLKMAVDFRSSVLEYLLPERLAAFPPEDIRKTLKELARTINSGEADTSETKDATNKYMAIFRLVEFHPERNSIVEDLEDQSAPEPNLVDNGIDPTSTTGALKLEVNTRINSLVQDLFSSGNRDFNVIEFVDSFTRLLKTGQRPKATEVISRLIDYMGSSDSDHRQKALNLLGAVLSELNIETDQPVLEATVEAIVERLESRRETYEYSELVSRLFDLCFSEQQLELMAKLTRAMARRRVINGNVTVYDSMAVKKAFENISRQDTVRQLVRSVIQATRDQVGCLKDIMVAIGTEEIALGLSRIISHPARPVRQFTLRTLAELGKSSLKVYSQILSDDAMFERPEGRREMPDEKYYVVRNSIFVLGSIQDPAGVSALRAHIADTDVRVKREIISALEKIGGEDAVDCLMLMAEDELIEIREAAVIAIGLIGTSDATPLLMDLARRMPGVSLKAVSALGKIGGDQARDFLCQLLENPRDLSDSIGGRVSKDELRLATVRALGRIGDSGAIGYLRSFQESRSGASKLFFKNSSVNKAISEILSRR